MTSLSFAPAASGLTTVSSKYSVKDAIDRIAVIASSKGMIIFARIDHRAEAAKFEVDMRPATTLFLGNPRANAALLAHAPTIATDLPWTVSAWEDGRRAVWVSYNSPEYLQARHNVPVSLMPNIASLGALVEQALR